MKQPYLKIILISFFLSSCASLPAGAQSGEPSFQITAGNLDDQVKILTQDDQTVIDISSPSGIGSATLELESGAMPEDVVLRLHLRGLEQLRLTSAQTSIEASVSNSNPADVQQRILAASREDPLAPDHPLWMPIEIVSEQAEKTIPLEEGYFEVTIPTEFLSKAGNSFEVQWTDFFR